MPTVLVIPAFDEAEYGKWCFGLRVGAPPIQDLALQRCEEALSHCVVVGVADGTSGRTPIAMGVAPHARRTQANAELIRQLARIGNNLNQRAYVTNSLGRVAVEARFRAVLDEALATIQRVE